MPVAFGPIDRTTLAEFRSSNEGAFEHIVRHGFPALAAAATAEGGDETATARVVEDAFMCAWRDREQFDTAEALETYLRAAVHRGAVRERSRRAALHRFEAHERVNVLPRTAAGAPLSADEVWNRVSVVLHTPQPSSESTARIRADVSRHEAASHVANIVKQRGEGMSVGPFAIVAIIVLAVIGGMVVFLKPTDGAARLDAALTASDARVRTTGAGQRAVVELTDQSRVALGPDSRLRIPPGFNESLRAVGLEGAAAFEVAPGGERPFLVRAGTATVRVTGTKFEMNAFPADDVVVVRVREGSVEVAAGETTRVLAAGEAAAIDADGAITAPGSHDVERALAWADDQFVVVDRPLREVVPLLNRWYGLDLNVADERLLDRKATVRAPLNSSRKAIEAVEATAGVKFGYQNEQKVLRDAATK